MASSKKYPPYGKAAVANPDQGNDKAIIICTGSSGFERAKNAQTYSWNGSIKHKIVLPFGTKPESYFWPVNGHIVAIYQFGTPENRQIIERLSVCCLHHGAARVLIIGADGMTRYLPQPQTEIA